MSAEIMSPESLGKQTGPIISKGANLLEQVGRVVITDDDVLATAGDLAKVINTQIKKSDEARTGLVKPLNDHVKWINAQFKETVEPMNKAKAELKEKMDAYVSERHERQEKEAAEARKLAEQEAIDRASVAENEGDTDTAEAIMDAAADLPEAVAKKPIARGDYGASTSTKTTWHGEIANLNDFLQAIIDGHIPPDYIEVSQAKLNSLATAKKVEKTNFGIKLFKKVSASVR